MKRGFLKIFLAMICLQSSAELFAIDAPICICKTVTDSPDNDPSYIRITNYNYNVGGGPSIGDDGATDSTIRLPFDFYLFGHRIDAFYVNVNGSISDIQVGHFHTTDFAIYDEQTSGATPVPSKFMIAPYWSDIHIGALDENSNGKHKCGDIYYKFLVKNGTDSVVGIKILWHEVGFYNGSCSCDNDINRKATFELILTNGDGSFLPRGKNIAFCYKKIDFAIGRASDGGATLGSSFVGDGIVAPLFYNNENLIYLADGTPTPGFLYHGTPATVGIVYKEDKNNISYYQIGQYDRPGVSLGDRVSVGVNGYTYNHVEGSGTAYSGYGSLLEMSDGCALVYDFSGKFSVNEVRCTDNGKASARIYGGSLGTTGVVYDIYVDNKHIGYSVSQNGSMQYDFELNADGGFHNVTVKCDGEDVFNEDIQSPQCGCGEGSSLEIDGITVDQSITVCQGLPIHIKYKSRRGLVNPRYVWSFNDMVIGQGGEMSSRIESFTAPRSGRLAVNIESDDCKESVNMEVNLNVNLCNPDECNECPSLFAPQAGEKYFVSGWVKDENQVGVDSFENVYLQVAFKLMGDDNLQEINCYPEGNIIDGWQRISGSFTIPARAENMSINLKNDGSSNEVYFDDIRFHPFNASMKSYVYDPKTLRLAAELDEENYATFYEYDEEGALVRIKKETERGVMTIREARQSKPKK